jgi:AcrR family transcriptional regulator
VRYLATWQRGRNGTSPPAVRKGDLRERQILDAAETLLDTRGYADMTVGEIAEAAGMTRGG